jgi:selenide,water dikinase
VKRLVLLGGGHAHVHVLKAFADHPIRDTRITLVSPFERQVYSGMLPGWIARHYSLEQCIIPLAPMAERAEAGFLQTAATALDLNAKRVTLANGESIGFDVLSIDTGPVQNSAIPGAEHALAVRPIESFIAAVQGIEQKIFDNASAGLSTRIVFCGAGAAGIELALALESRFRASKTEFTLISLANTLPGRVGPKLAQHLTARNVRLITGRAASRIESGRVILDDGQAVEADIVIASTGSAAAAWPAQAGLACDTGGFIRANTFLQSVSHPFVFAAGDCATMDGQPRPKSGVYAVRAGPPLAANLRQFLFDNPLKPYSPQKNSLYLISTGGKHAIGSWGSFAWEGNWVWRWKDRIDRAFMRRYAALVSPKD